MELDEVVGHEVELGRLDGKRAQPGPFRLLLREFPFPKRPVEVERLVVEAAFDDKAPPAVRLPVPRLVLAYGTRLRGRGASAFRPRPCL